MESYIIREPILDGNLSVFGYRLHRRPPSEVGPARGGADVDAPRVIADLALVLGIDAVTGGHKGIVTVTRDVLLGDFIRTLPSELTIVGIPATLAFDQAAVAACRSLADARYELAVVDVDESAVGSPLLGLATLATVDVQELTESRWLQLGDRLSSLKKKPIATGVESWKIYRLAMQNDYCYAAGRFFARPQIAVGKDIPGHRLAYVHLILEIHRAELDFDRVAEIIKRDLSLTYKLLRCVNSVHYGMRDEVKSIKHAAVLIGERAIKRWVSLLAITAITEKKPPECVQEALIRATLCESLAAPVGLAHRDQELFLLGLLSVLDALLDRPLPQILDALPLAADLRSAFSEHDSRLGELLRCVIAYVSGDWPTFSRRANRLGIRESTLPPLYLEALKWTQTSLRQVPKAA